MDGPGEAGWCHVRSAPGSGTAVIPGVALDDPRLAWSSRTICTGVPEFLIFSQNWTEPQGHFPRCTRPLPQMCLATSPDMLQERLGQPHSVKSSGNKIYNI